VCLKVSEVVMINLSADHEGRVDTDSQFKVPGTGPYLEEAYSSIGFTK